MFDNIFGKMQFKELQEMYRARLGKNPKDKSRTQLIKELSTNWYGGSRTNAGRKTNKETKKPDSVRYTIRLKPSTARLLENISSSSKLKKSQIIENILNNLKDFSRKELKEIVSGIKNILCFVVLEMLLNPPDPYDPADAIISSFP